MSVSIVIVTEKLALSMISLARECPLNKVARNEYNIALSILKSVNDEYSTREAINRALCHLESAFGNFRIFTWDIWDEDKVLWSKRTFANSICLHIAILHYMLDNRQIAKEWLLDRLNVMGSIYFPYNILDSLSMNDESDFYKAVADTDYVKVEELVSESKSNYDYVYGGPDWSYDDLYF